MKIGYFPTMFIAERLLARLSPTQRATLGQFVRFCAVGFAGLAVDVATVYAARGWVGIYAAGLLAYGTAVTATFLLNRAWTFAGMGRGGVWRQYGLFIAANAVGAMLNRGTFFALVTLVPVCAAHPVLAIFAGTAAGLFANFTLSRRLVFRNAQVAE